MKKFLLYALLAATCSLTAKAATIPTTIDYDYGVTIQYQLNSEDLTAVVTGSVFDRTAEGFTGEVIVPAKIAYSSVNYTVKAIGLEAWFNNTIITSITIPNTVTEIRDRAFKSCTNLKTVNIGSGLETLGSEVFSNSGYYTGLKAINVDPANEKFCSIKGVLYGRENAQAEPTSLYFFPHDAPQTTEDGPYELPWETVGLRVFKIPSSVRTIKHLAFYCAPTNTVILPESLETIEDDAFFLSSAGYFNLPATVTEIGDRALATSSIKGIDVSKDNPVFSSMGGALYNKDQTTLLYCPQGKTSIEIPSTVTNIDQYALYSNKLTDITCYAVRPPVLSASNNPFSNVTVKVPASSVSEYQSANYWSTCTIQAIGTDLTIADGTVYQIPSNFAYSSLTYTRTFDNTSWQAWYVPFDVSVRELEAKGLQAAELYDTHNYDVDGDGVYETQTLEFLRLTSGVVPGNRPALVRANTTGTVTLELTNGTALPAENVAIDCSSTKQMFIFQGTYQEIAGSIMYNNGYYAIGNGNLSTVANYNVSLKPQRWFMKIVDRTATANNPAPTIRVEVLGEDTFETALDTHNTQTNDSPIYTLEGKRVVQGDLKPGIYVQNGKKVMVK